jgi:serine/threonine protein kinase
MMSMGASSPAWLAPGCRLDRYDLLLRIAEGGMATLWLARQEGKHGFDKIVAIKTILPKLARDPGFQRMFLDEAGVVARIEHPNVARVLDLGEERGVLFLVMEWIDGESLGDLGHAVEREANARIPVGILGRVMVDVCAGLHAAHELEDDLGLSLGVVHRDISPDNLLVGFRGATTVIDFGIAKARNRMAQDTRVGILKGKIAYMAPEQAMGTGVDRRADIWSAGASMYRFLAGSVPYSATEPLAVLRRITEGLPPAPLPPGVPAPIRLVVERALEPDARKRFETAQAMGVALERAMREADADTSHGDVAEFMDVVMGEGRARRTREIEYAVRESRTRVRVEGTDRQTASSERARDSRDPVRPSSRPSRHPTAIAALPAADARALAETPPRSADDVPTSSELRGRIVPPIALLAAPARAHGRWGAGAALLVGALLAAAAAWHATQPSRPVEATRTPPSPVVSPAPREEPFVLLPPAPPASTRAPEALASAAASPPGVQPVGPTPLVEPALRERGSAEDVPERARLARRAGRLDDAPASSAPAVEKAPADSEALTHLADAEVAQGATARALADYRGALVLNPRYLPARLGVADSLWKSGERDEARVAYRAIVTQFPPYLCPERARERGWGEVIQAPGTGISSTTSTVPSGIMK